MVKLIYNLLEYSFNYSDTQGRFWFYAKDEEINFNADIANDNIFQSLKYKAELLGKTAAYGID